MKRVKLVLAYDGTNYCGWQMQPNGITVEEVLNKALKELLHEEIQVIGASRTDSGVHALGNVAVFDTESRIPAEKMCFALNQRLPMDIVVQSSCEVPLTWHPRKCNTIKTYEYRILNRKLPDPTVRLNSYFFYMPLDVEKMQEAADYLIGEHDFKSFCSIRTQIEDTVRTITGLTLKKDGDMITLRISGNGFLYNMVRIIVGTLIKVGTGYYPPSHMEQILDARNRNQAGPKAPAHGLTLVSIIEEEELKKEIHVENKYMDYIVVQREIMPKQKAYIIINRCVNEDFKRTILRLSKQAVRNGAKTVHICDREGRLCEGYTADYFTFRFDTSVYKMLLRRSLAWSKKEVPPIHFSELTDKNSLDFLQIQHQAFADVPNGASYSKKELIEIMDNPMAGAWLISDEKDSLIGVAEWEVKDTEFRIAMIGLLPKVQGQGYGKSILVAMSEQAKQYELPITLLVTSKNDRACMLYEMAGFVSTEKVSDWYVTEDELKQKKEEIEQYIVDQKSEKPVSSTEGFWN
ncbi:MAG: tRNA pseudouridine(38-40) synthase TruA [Clostridiales bacterium]|nr:tRNA pseudouridine(38-40) synthase TruA [Clostridiales bacterium]